MVGDALGAPFEFGAPAEYSAVFPEPVLLDPGEMVGGGGWDPAEWTDDTQMALLVAQSLLDHQGLDEADIFERFHQWLAGHPKDVGNQTRAVLGSGLPLDEAAAQHFARTGHAAGNGSLMRTVPAALFFASHGTEVTAEMARRVSALTHGDPAAGDGCAMYHELIRVALDGDDPLDAVESALEFVPDERRSEYAWRLAPDYNPAADPVRNGAVWPAMGVAVWALRHARSFPEVMRLAIDLGGDTDTIACIAGGLAGAVYSVGAIPSRWTTYLHGAVIGRDDSGIGLDHLHSMARGLLAGRTSPPPIAPAEHAVGPVHVGGDRPVYAASLPGAAAAFADNTLPPGAMVISLSRAAELVDHRPRRAVFMVDQSGEGRNLGLSTALADAVATMQAALNAGMAVLVHCHGGRSRTGLVLRAWLLAERPDLTVDEASAVIAERWPHLDTWNSSFTAALADFAVHGR